MILYYNRIISFTWKVMEYLPICPLLYIPLISIKIISAIHSLSRMVEVELNPFVKKYV